MADVVFMLIVVAFFAVCVLYIRACDRVITGGDPSDGAEEAGR